MALIKGANGVVANVPDSAAESLVRDGGCSYYEPKTEAPKPETPKPAPRKRAPRKASQD